MLISNSTVLALFALMYFMCFSSRCGSFKCLFHQEMIWGEPRGWSNPDGPHQVQTELYTNMSTTRTVYSALAHSLLANESPWAEILIFSQTHGLSLLFLTVSSACIVFLLIRRQVIVLGFFLLLGLRANFILKYYPLFQYCNSFLWNVLVSTMTTV